MIPPKLIKYKLTIFFITALLLAGPLTSRSQVVPDTSVHEIVVDSQSVYLSDTAVMDPEEVSETAALDTTYREISNRLDTLPYSYPDSLTLRSVSAQTADSFRNAKVFAYANDPRYWKKVEPLPETKTAEPGLLEKILSSNTTRIVMYVLLGLFLMYVIYRIIVNNSLFYGPSKKITAESEEINEEEIRDLDIDTRIKQAIQSGDQRLATRYMYLKSLQRLDLAGLIRYHPQATNHEYTRQLSAHALSADFGLLTHIYEYIWYGEFSVNEEQFTMVQAHFDKFYKSVRS